MEDGDGVPTTVVRALRSGGIPDATPAKTTGSQGAAQKEGSSSAGEGSTQLECVPGSQVGVNRTLIECCCGEDTLLGKRTESSRGCKVYRITEKVDMTKPEVVRGCDLLLRDGTCALWLSCPCTGGSAWQRYRPQEARKLRSLSTDTGRNSANFGRLLPIWPPLPLVVECESLSNGRVVVRTGRTLGSLGSLLNIDSGTPTLTAACTVSLPNRALIWASRSINHGEWPASTRPFPTC